MAVLDEIKKIIEKWEERNKQLDEMLTSLNKTIEQTNKSMVSMQNVFDNMSTLIIKVSGDYSAIKVKLDNLETKLKNNRWMKFFGVV